MSYFDRLYVKTKLSLGEFHQLFRECGKQSTEHLGEVDGVWGSSILDVLTLDTEDVYRWIPPEMCDWGRVGFEPTIKNTLTYFKFTKDQAPISMSETITNIVLPIVNCLLQRSNDDLAFTYLDGKVVLRCVNGVVQLNSGAHQYYTERSKRGGYVTKEKSYWSPERLAKITIPYELVEFKNDKEEQ